MAVDSLADGIVDIIALASVALSIFLVMNPFSSIPTFLSVTKGGDAATIRSYANHAVIVAAVLLFVFVFIGSPLMSLFGVTMESFRVAGGLILIMMGVEIVFGLKFSKNADEKDAPWIIIATPIMTGPGVITAAILFTEQYGYLEVVLAGIVALLATWVLLRLSQSIVKLIGENALNVTSRIVGLLLAALGVEYILEGANQWVYMYWGDAAMVLLGM